VLGHYVTDGVGELDPGEKLNPLLHLKYGATADAIATLGNPAEINQLFVSFQPWLYQPGADASE
jgi:hypothetical protein